MVAIRDASKHDRDAVWEIFRTVVAAGDTYVFDPEKFVVSTNEAAVKLWERLGFTIVGNLPGAFRHGTRGFVDAYVMFQTLL
jgi:hypothetical protein